MTSWMKARRTGQERTDENRHDTGSTNNTPY